MLLLLSVQLENYTIPGAVSEAEAFVFKGKEHKIQVTFKMVTARHMCTRPFLFDPGDWTESGGRVRV